MSERGAAKAKEDALASGATPRPEGRVRERGWRPTREEYGIGKPRAEAARPRAIAAADGMAFQGEQPVRRPQAVRAKAPPAPWLETLRLELRGFVARDFDDLWRLDSDPRVMQYIADGKPASRDAVEQRLERFIRYPALYPDLGVWRTARRDTGAFIGWFCFNYAGSSTDIEVGYRLLPKAWGQGYATEGARALVDYGFDDLDLDRIIGVTHPGNKPSQRVLMNAGLEDRGWGRYYNRRLRLFAADNPYR